MFSLDSVMVVKNIDGVEVRRMMTPITPMVNGCCVVVVQEATDSGSPGLFLGCILRIPDCDDIDRPMLLLSEAFREFNKKIGLQEGA